MKFHWAADAVITETRAAGPDQSGDGSRCADCGSARSTITSSSRRRGPCGRASGCWRGCSRRLPLSIVRAVRLIVTEQKPLFALHPMAVAVGSALAVARHRTATLQSLEDRLVSQFVDPSGNPRRLRRIAPPAGDGYAARRDLHRHAAAGLGVAAAVHRSRAIEALKDLSTGNETLTYLAFGVLAVLMVALAMRDNLRGAGDAAVAGVHPVRRLDRAERACCRSIPAPRFAGSR